jgi:hypothetical protein
MFIIRFLGMLSSFICVEIPLQLLGAVILLVYLPFSKSEQLPYVLRWFDCADFYVGRNTDTYRSVVAQGWYARYCWLAWRNPINYFEYSVLGAKVIHKPLVTVQNRSGKPEIGTSKGDISGLYHCECDYGQGTIYEYYYIYGYKVPFTNIQKCVRFRMGYKIDYPESNKIGSIIQHCLVFNPFASYEGVL